MLLVEGGLLGDCGERGSVSRGVFPGIRAQFSELRAKISL